MGLVGGAVPGGHPDRGVAIEQGDGVALRRGEGTPVGGAGFGPLGELEAVAGLGHVEVAQEAQHLGLVGHQIVP